MKKLKIIKKKINVFKNFKLYKNSLDALFSRITQTNIKLQ